MTLKTEPFNPMDYFENEQEVVDYLTEAYQDDDPNVFVVALGHVVKKRGVAEVAREAGLSRESLYRTLSGQVQPKWDTVHRLLKALNIRIKIAA